MHSDTPPYFDSMVQSAIYRWHNTHTDSVEHLIALSFTLCNYPPQHCQYIHSCYCTQIAPLTLTYEKIGVILQFISQPSLDD